MKRNLIAVISIASLFIAISCADNNHMPIKTGVKGGGLSGNSGAGAGSTKLKEISYNDVLPIFQKCTICHVPGSAFPPDWMNYDIAKAKADRIMDRVFVQKNMPLQPVTLTDEELKTLKKWLDAGAPPAAVDQPVPSPTPEATPTPEPTVTPDPNATPEPTPLPELPPANGTYTYVKDIRPIFMNRCIVCHMEGGGLPFWGDYETTKSKLDRLMDRIVIKRDMPMGMPMEDIERSMIKSWIDQGGLKE